MLSALAVAIAAAGGWFWFLHDPTPNVNVQTPQLPTPNAYDKYFAAANRAVEDTDISWAVDGIDTTGVRLSQRGMEAVLARHSWELAQFRQGLEMDFLMPAARSFTHPVLPERIMGPRGPIDLEKLLLVETRVLMGRGDWPGAMGSRLDALELAIDWPHGGPIMLELAGVTLQVYVNWLFPQIMENLSADEAIVAVRRLELIGTGRRPFADALREEKRFMQAALLEVFSKPQWRDELVQTPTAFGEYSGGKDYRNELRSWKKRQIMRNVTEYLDAWLPIVQKPYAAYRTPPPLPSDPVCTASYGPGEIDLPIIVWIWFMREKARVEIDFQMITLALHAYRLQEGEYPERLREMTPAIIGGVPQDPFALEGLYGYRRTSEGYLLYSIGPDGVDDGGTPCETKDPADGSVSHIVRENSRGDIVAGVNL
ncbi:MAG: hypothetical protein IH851_05635 [Armatimonadetes bacterium]|nr:hypothetical protein [Armatimonadota bacterium]